MSADFKKLEERVAFLEREVRRTSALIDFVEARADKSLVGMNQHLDTQDTQLQEFIQETRAQFETLEQAVQETRQAVQGANTRLDSLEQLVQETRTRLAGLEQAMQETKQAVQANATRLDSVEQLARETKQVVQETNEFVSSQAESTNKRFDYVYGKFADLEANMMEMRNLLAFLVEKQK